VNACVHRGKKIAPRQNWQLKNTENINVKSEQKMRKSGQELSKKRLLTPL
jgi:hypothetical protein